MAERHQQVYPIAQRSDTEKTNNSGEKELKRKKKVKIAIYVAIFAVFQVAVITVFALVVMRAKSPKVRLSKDVEIRKLDTVSTPLASFDMSLATQVRVTNPNWGPYKFENTTMMFSYNGTTVGQVVISKGKAGMKSTKKVDVVVDLDSKRLTDTTKLGAELGEGTLTLTSSARVTGKVELMFIMKKNKSGNMVCTIVIDVGAKNLKSLQCK